MDERPLEAGRRSAFRDFRAKRTLTHQVVCLLYYLTCACYLASRLGCLAVGFAGAGTGAGAFPSEVPTGQANQQEEEEETHVRGWKSRDPTTSTRIPHHKPLARGGWLVAGQACGG
jgi:hypothetical protein